MVFIFLRKLRFAGCLGSKRKKAILVRFNPKTDLRMDSVVKYDLRLSRANITFHFPSFLLPNLPPSSSSLTYYIMLCFVIMIG
ncbi:hypothetical protein GQ457_03G045720 [Hibiscus cannabinus]